MSSVITLKDNNTIEVELNNLQSNDMITVSIDESKIVSVDGNYKMSDLLAGGSDSSEEGSDEDGSCALDCVGIFEALDADLDEFCTWLSGLGGTGAECFSDCTATFLADLDSTCVDGGIEDEEDAQNDINTGVLTKLTFTAGESAGLDTLHIKETSFLRTSLNVPIDILDRVYGLIEVIE